MAKASRSGGKREQALGKQYVRIGAGDFLMALKSIQEKGNTARIVAEIAHDLVPAEDNDGEINFTGRHLQYLTEQVESAMDGIWRQVREMLELGGFDPQLYTWSE